MKDKKQFKMIECPNCGGYGKTRHPYCSICNGSYISGGIAFDGMYSWGCGDVCDACDGEGKLKISTPL